MISSILEASIRQCAQASIGGTLSIASLRMKEYRTRTAALDARLERAEADVARQAGSVTGSRALVQLTVAINSLEAAVAGANDLIKTTFGSFASAIKALPDLLVNFVNQSGLEFPLNISSSTVCRYVETALRPHLQTMSGDLDQARTAIDLRIAELEAKIQKLETLLAG